MRRSGDGRPDAIQVKRDRSGIDYERNPAAERKAMIRFLAYLKPSIHYFALASICGVSLYLGPMLIPTSIGYGIDHFLRIAQPEAGSQAAHATSNVLYRMIGAYLHHFVSPRASAQHQLNFLLGSLLVYLPLWAVLVFFRAFLAGTGGQRVIFKLRNDLYDHIQTLPLSFFQKNRSGSVVSRMTSDIAAAQNFIGNACTNLWMDSLSVIILGAFLFSVDWRLACVAFAILPLWITSVRVFGQRIRRHSLAVQEGLSELSGVVQEKVSGATVVKAFARERGEMLSFLKLHRALLNRQVDQVRANAMNMTASNLLTTLAPVTVVMYGAHEVFTGRLSVGTLLMFYVMLNTFYNPLQRITDLAAVIATSSAAIERIFQILDEKPDVVDKPDAIELKAPAKGRISFEHVHFTYEGADRDILSDINLTVEPGQVIAFVGPSGAGKSTLIQLLPRFYDVVSGRIRLDGYDIRDLKMSSLRKQIGMVLQDNILFTGTIRENILYGRPNASDREILDAAIAANADGFINEMPDGYETQIGERGTKLSGGQKQRIAITRAFLRNPPVLILDEATSALDSESEKQIQSALNRLMVGRTTLIIAHRLSTIMHADKIVVMQHGRIVQTGTHRELLEAGGVYAQLYKAQHQHLAMEAPPPPKDEKTGAGCKAA
jgi:subfamily B ATP-binding cassette protein MsbA